MEKELLSVIATFKEFRSMLLGAELHVHTDHKNLTFSTLNTQRVLRWRLYLEEYAPTFHYIRGLDNVLADYLSRAPLSSPEVKQVVSLPPIGIPIDESDTFHSVLPDDPQLLDCSLSFPLDSFLNVPVEVHHNPIDYQRIHALQQAVQMQQFHHHDPVRYPLHTFGQFQIVCYHIPGQHNWRIYLPDALLPDLVHCVTTIELVVMTVESVRDSKSERTS